MIDSYLKKTKQKDYDTKVPEDVKKLNADKIAEYTAQMSILKEDIERLKQI